MGLQTHRHSDLNHRNHSMAAESELKLLLIEDSSTDAALIRASLRLGLPRAEVTHVERLQAAVECVRQQRFSAVLLDLNLPDSSGVPTFRRLSSACDGTPIVVLSGMEDTETAIQAVAAGAEDYVQKNQFDAQALSRSVRFAIERRTRMLAETELLQIRSELRAAQNIQDRLYPRSAPDFPGIQIGCGVRSAGMGCGDYYDFIPLKDGRHIIVVGDVSGHGMGSALVMAETRACLRTLVDVETPPSQMPGTLNRLICAGATPGMFVTLVLVVYDPKAMTFEYFNAGHPGWIISQTQSHALVTHQIPLGFDEDSDYSNSTRFQLTTGQVLLLPTDGLHEMRGADGMFGMERLLNTVRQNQHLSAQQIVNHLFESAMNFSVTESRADDMTAVAVKAV